MICTFFGHNNTPSEASKQLEAVLTELIEKNPGIKFYVGHNGNFDRMARSVLKKLNADYEIVLAYLPKAGDRTFEDEPTLYPDGLEAVPQRFAISHRNRWMVQNSDMVIAYISRTASRAAEFVKYAENQGREVINLADCQKLK